MNLLCNTKAAVHRQNMPVDITRCRGEQKHNPICQLLWSARSTCRVPIKHLVKDALVDEGCIAGSSDGWRRASEVSPEFSFILEVNKTYGLRAPLYSHGYDPLVQRRGSWSSRQSRPLRSYTSSHLRHDRQHGLHGTKLHTLHVADTSK
jgi:hypothetical protein